MERRTKQLKTRSSKKADVLSRWFSVFAFRGQNVVSDEAYPPFLLDLSPLHCAWSVISEMPRYELSREGHMLKFEGGGAGRPLNEGPDSATEPPDKSNSETPDRTKWLDYRVKYTLSSLRALVVSRDPTFKTKKAEDARRDH
jgi:hypothetical protein